MLGIDWGVVELGEDLFVLDSDDVSCGNILRAKLPPSTRSTTPIKPRQPMSNELVFLALFLVVAGAVGRQVVVASAAALANSVVFHNSYRIYSRKQPGQRT